MKRISIGILIGASPQTRTNAHEIPAKSYTRPVGRVRTAAQTQPITRQYHMRCTILQECNEPHQSMRQTRLQLLCPERLAHPARCTYKHCKLCACKSCMFCERAGGIVRETGKACPPQRDDDSDTMRCEAFCRASNMDEHCDLCKVGGMPRVHAPCSCPV